MTELITLERHSEGRHVGVLHMRDEASRNTFTDEFVDAFMEQLRAIRSNCEYKVIILKGLPDVFCAGASKDALLSLFGGEVNVKDLELSELLLQVPVPVIAAMEGAALGGGFVVALCCDIVVMNERRMYGVNFTNMGFSPGMGCTGLIQSLVGEFVANEMMFRGRLFKGKTFKGRSLINYILPEEKVMKKAVDIALDIDEKPKGTVEVLKYSLSSRKKQALIDARVREDFMHKITFAQPEVKSMIEELYNDKA